MRQYITPAYWQTTALGAYWARQTSGTMLDDALAKASEDADNYCRLRVLAPAGATPALPAATLVAGTTVGATQLSVNSVVGLDDDMQMMAVIDTGASQETVLILGVAITDWHPPYPGNLYLAAPLALNHALGASVAGAYRENWTLKGDSDMILLEDGTVTRMTKSIGWGYASLSINRVIRLTNAPLISLLSATYTYNGDPSTLTTLPLTGSVTINGVTNPNGALYQLNAVQGWYRLPVTASVPIQGASVQTTYVGGYATCPLDLAEAVGLFAAHRLATGQAYIAQDMASQRTADRDVVVGPGTTMRRAAEILDSRYKKKAMGFR